MCEIQVSIKEPTWTNPFFCNTLSDTNIIPIGIRDQQCLGTPEFFGIS